MRSLRRNGKSFTRGRVARRKVSEKALLAFKARVRELTRRTRGRTMRQIVKELRTYVLGWRGYYGFAEVISPLRDLDTLDPASATWLPLEAMGPEGLPGASEAGHLS